MGTALLTALFAMRAIGEFRFVGLFKTQREGLFARRDTWIYTPLCISIAALSAWLTGRAGTP